MSSNSKPILRPLQTTSLRERKKSTSNQGNAACNQHLVGQQFLTASNANTVGIYKLKKHCQEFPDPDTVGVPVVTISECEDSSPPEPQKSREEEEAALCSRLQAMYRC